MAISIRFNHRATSCDERFSGHEAAAFRIWALARGVITTCRFNVAVQQGHMDFRWRGRPGAWLAASFGMPLAGLQEAALRRCGDNAGLATAPRSSVQPGAHELVFWDSGTAPVSPTNSVTRRPPTRRPSVT